MKKEFKAPIVEAKQLSIQDELMISAFSSGENTGLAKYNDETVASDFKLWKNNAQ